MLSACAGPKVTPEVKKAYESHLMQFVDNLDSFISKDESGSAVLDLLKTFRRSYERFDLNSIKNMLAKDFTFHYFGAYSRIKVEDRSTFLTARNGWKLQEVPSRRFLVSIKSYVRSSNGQDIIITGLTNHVSKYFNPKFQEIYIFNRNIDGWKLRLWMIIPIYVVKPELHEIQIIVGEYATKDRYSHKNFADKVMQMGPDILIDQYLKKVGKKYPEKHENRPMLYIFKEPPAPGTIIRIEERHLSSRGDVYFETEKSYEVKESTPYFFIFGHAFGNFRSGESIECKAYVDNKLVHYELLPIF
jgi:hypothetical protein